MSRILEVSGLTMRFGGLVAVSAVTMCQESGEILALIGPNGAGKTTLFNVLTGVYQPSEGSVVFKGEDITALAPYERVRKGISRTFQNIRLFKGMTTLENLLVACPECAGEGIAEAVLGGRALRRKRGLAVQRCQRIMDILRLSEHEGELAHNLPYGKQRLLEIGRAMATGADYLLLDEPGAGMNRAEKSELTEAITTITRDLRKDVLLIEHDMAFVMNISDKVVVLDHGEKIAEGLPEQIQSDQQVIEAYLGKGIMDDDDDDDDD